MSIFIALISAGGLLGFIILMWLLSGFKVAAQYERGIVFVLGRLTATRGPGLYWVVPGISRIRKIDLRTLTIEVPPQEVITRDNVTIKVNAVVYFYVVDPSRAVTNVVDYMRATVQIAQTTLRNVLGQSELDQILAERELINHRLQTIIDEHTEPWGVKVTTVELKDLELPATMQRAMAKQAEAEREKRAKVIAAEGEFQASSQLAAAAAVISREPAALQLRYLQTLVEIAVEKNSTIVFPLPIDLVEPITDLLRNAAARSNAANPPSPAPPASPLLQGERTSPELPPESPSA